MADIKTTMSEVIEWETFQDQRFRSSPFENITMADREGTPSELRGTRPF